MNIALIAHSVKKELMANFCIAYKGILENHVLYATGGTGTIVQETTQLDVTLLSSGSVGHQQLIARIAYNEIDLVIFFNDFHSNQTDWEDVRTMFQLCSSNNIPIATNIATAEMLVKSLERGDLDWRIYYRD